MYILLIYNPNAGNQSFVTNFDMIVYAFQKKGFRLLLHRLDRTNSLSKALKHVKERESDFEKVIIAGGDGTINQVVSLMIKHELNLPIGIYPVGTCNDFSMQYDLTDALETQTKILLQDHYETCDVGRVNDRYFINIASMGLFVTAGQRTDPKLKTFLGPLAYYVNALDELMNLKDMKLEIEGDGVHLKDKFYIVLILNGTSAGGFSKIGQDASSNDGFLDVVLFKKCDNKELPGLFIDVLNGKHTENENVVSFKTTTLKISGSEDILTDVDGEKGPSLPLSVSIFHDQLKVLTLTEQMSSGKISYEKQIERNVQRNKKKFGENV